MEKIFDAKIAQLDYKERCGELVDAHAVAKVVTDAASIIQTSLERIPDRLAERVAAESNPADCHALLTAEMDAALAELTALCDRMAAQVKA
jgi:phage terminase Nu1 subunit (DNA packaging protein)